ncbi:PWWP domain-containing protein [Drechmeria coniospora]|uniref:PWWP domain-containing protein n=1 Tax=Drechmeria coniospora TaxID=98403 RepID=A0A151GE99_DRECN|nr:PWWP domain-containing protein [Drechmeria coniospora]KYK55419.1 PWWP domain-containing protein [Drechmeria coniospora]
MADKCSENSETTTAAAAPAPSVEEAPAPEPTSATAKEHGLSGKDEPKPDSEAAAEGAKSSDDAEPETAKKDKAEASTAEEKPVVAEADVEMKDGTDDAAAPAATETPASKAKANRRKSTGEAKGKSLSKKASKARLTHIDAQPGDHFLVKLKGFPAWPAIVCDESMLPAALISSRPVSAAQEDGTFAGAYADGGKRVHDRSFPVMYLHTNEFGWVQNMALSELTAEKARDTITEKMRKDLKAAFELAAECNPIDEYKEMLKKFQEEQLAQEQAMREAAATPRKSKKGKGKAAEEEDEDMDDVEAAPKSAKSKKRKAEDEASTPQRTDSAKKPKIKLNTSSTPKAVNGAATPKSTGSKAAKATKGKPKKTKEVADKKENAKESKMTPEERHARKEVRHAPTRHGRKSHMLILLQKEVLYLRHKLQRGLLTREQQPREDEMKAMSDFITMLEGFVDLEVSIIRSTKINKVLKAILKLEAIPREEEFQFKKRSQSLLDKWNKLLASDGSAPASASTNGVNGAGEEKKTASNDVKADEAAAVERADAEIATDTKSVDEEAETGGADKPTGEEATDKTPAADAVEAA